jgi:hypothetical protein
MCYSIYNFQLTNWPIKKDLKFAAIKIPEVDIVNTTLCNFISNYLEVY